MTQRLSAILAADATGYSRLMALDAAATVASLDAARLVFRAQIEAARGRVVDMAGDSVLAVFDTAIGAVAAALAIQTHINAAADAVPEDHRMRFRIGLHLGDLIEKADGSVYGDGVNIAARLEGLADPGGITISESVRAAVKGKVTASFEDRGEQTVKNILDPVRTYRLHEDGKTTPAPPSAALPVKAVPAVVDLSLPDKPSIAVLPFANMSGDPEQEYFTDGISEDIITELSRFESLFVIARNSSFSYKGKTTDIRQIGKELGVRYVLEGSIRKAANRVRVTAQLIDSHTGSHIWAEKFDRVLEDIFAVQEEVTECIVGAIAPQIDAAEALRARRRPGNLSAHELAVRSKALAWDGFQKSDLAARDEALRLAREALAIDPESILALSMVAFVQYQHIVLRTVEDRASAWYEGMNAAMRGISIAQSNVCHGNKAFLLTCAPGGSRWDEARMDAQEAARLNPQDAQTLSGCGYILANAGDPAQGIALLERSLRINPRDPFAFLTYSNLANAHLAARDYARGLEWANRAVGAAPDFANARGIMAALWVGLGDIDKAKAALEAARRLTPQLEKNRVKPKPDAAFDVSGGLEAKDAGWGVRHRYQVFIRVASGREDPRAADPLR